MKLFTFPAPLYWRIYHVTLFVDSVESLAHSGIVIFLMDETLVLPQMH